MTTARKPEIRTPIPGPRSRDLAKRLKAVEAPGITYLASDFPVFWERAAGSTVEDVDGNVFVDLSAAFGVAALGHAPPGVIGFVQEQLTRLPHGMGDVHPPAIKVRLLEHLAEWFPAPGSRTILCCSGAEAVEAALKTARLASGRPGVISFRGAYHGLTFGALAVSGQPRFFEPFRGQLTRFSHMASFPQAGEEVSLRELDGIAEGAASGPFPVGAVVVEPIQGRAGVIVPPDGWLSALRDWTRRQGILLIADEIMTGFGRTGRRFAVDREDVVPDLLCVGKALTGMLPFAACMGTEAVMKAWPASTGEALHTSTFLGNPLGCAAALASLAEIQRLDLAARAERLGTEVLEELGSWRKALPLLRDVRGRGLMLGLELASGGRTGLAFEAARRALARGVILLPSGEEGNVISLTPPLVIEKDQLQWALGELRGVLSGMS